ncbi:hypothetical protein LR48_Vigan831s001600 [Vigna angularis]|uniref:BHLH domain-containing protein n=1 Tax=Phaseolus angularis TaxID=3914 RepID=A0A0L9TH11_PHAAN|nr:hypothetical protein LR48_Vigan831s001600 [Vigna angularis]
MELLWHNGQVVMQSQNHRSLRKPMPPPRNSHDASAAGPSEAREIRPQLDNFNQHLFMQEGEMASWLHYPIDVDDVPPLDQAFCADFLYSPPTVNNSTAMQTLATSQLTDHRPMSAPPRPPIPLPRRLEPKTPNFAYFARHNTRAAEESVKASAKESTDVDFESEAKKQARGSTSTKRSRAAEVHNLSERRRRDRINEKMRALQELIPRCNKMMSMGCGMVPMMFPGIQQYMPAMGMGVGMGMGMEMGMNRPVMPFPNMLPGSALPAATAAAHLGPRFPMPPFHMPRVPAPDSSRMQAENQSDKNMVAAGPPDPNHSRLPNFTDPYQQYLGPHQMQFQVIQIIKYLLAVSEMSPETRNLNRESLIAMETLEQYPRDFRTLSISRQEEASSQSIGVVIVQEDPPQASSSSSSSLTNNDTPQTSAAPSLPRNDLPEASAAPVPSPKMNMSSEQGEDRWSRLERFCRTYLLDEGNWIDKKTREQLMVAATVIATMTFQSVISPPGGVWQGDTTEDGFTCPDYGFCEAGTAVVGYAWSPDFMKFIFFNSCSFFSSLCVMLLLMSGFPLENRVVMWILAILMIAAASCMLLTYMWALGLVSPNHIYYRIRKLGYLLVGTWSLLLALVASVQLSRIAFWIKSRRKKSTNAPL